MAAAAQKSVKDLLSADEKKKIKQVIVALAKAGVADDMIGCREVMITAMVSASVAEAVKQYRNMLGALDEFKFTLKDLYDPKVLDRVQKHFRMFFVCGKDQEGLGIMWIVGEPVPVAEEQVSVMASMLYWMAVHSDVVTLRNGITLTLDSTDRGNAKIGNEKKLRKARLTLPVKTKRLFIVGAGFFKRMVINGLIKVARLFGGAIQNPQFVEMEAVHEVVPEKSRPNYSLSSTERMAMVKAFVQQRLSTLPRQIGAKNCLSEFV